MPRAGLTPPVVVDLALDVVDEGGRSGWADLGLSAVAQRAGVAVPSLYKHVDGLPGLRSAVAARCVQDLTDTMTRAITAPTTGSPDAAAGAPPGADEGSALTGAEAVRALAAAIRTYALAHPGRYRAVQGAETAALGPASSGPVDLVARAVRELGLPPDRWVDQVRTVRAAVHGFVELELGGGFGLPEDVDASFGYLVETVVAGLR